MLRLKIFFWSKWKEIKENFLYLWFGCLGPMVFAVFSVMVLMFGVCPLIGWPISKINFMSNVFVNDGAYGQCALLGGFVIASLAVLLLVFLVVASLWEWIYSNWKEAGRLAKQRRKK